METLISEAPPDTWMKIRDVIELGVNHEEQHREPILMDIKHVFSVNPLQPAFAATAPCHGAVPADERVHIEYSYKYEIEEFQALAAGFTPAAVWTDPARMFGVHYLAT